MARYVAFGVAIDSDSDLTALYSLYYCRRSHAIKYFNCDVLRLSASPPSATFVDPRGKVYKATASPFIRPEFCMARGNYIVCSYYGLGYFHESNFVALPLRHVRATVAVKEIGVQVKLTQTFGNDTQTPIEAVYAFPVPARAAVSGFVMIKEDGTRVVGVVQEKGEAKATYDVAVAQGKTASLMGQETPDGTYICFTFGVADHRLH